MTEAQTAADTERALSQLWKSALCLRMTWKADQSMAACRRSWPGHWEEQISQRCVTSVTEEYATFNVARTE